jgi:hypothetical protein
MAVTAARSMVGLIVVVTGSPAIGSERARTR